MKLTADRFYKGHFNFQRCANCVVESVPRYSYESRTRLHDVFTIDGKVCYRVNGHFVDTPDHIHKAIAEHFKGMVS